MNKGKAKGEDVVKQGVFNKGSISGMVDKYYTMNPEQKCHLHPLREEAGGKRQNASGVNSNG
jgi:hypothetical protein